MYNNHTVDDLLVTKCDSSASWGGGEVLVARFATCGSGGGFAFWVRF